MSQTQIQNYINNLMPAMDGWCSKTKAEALVKAVLEQKPEVVVEIGVFGGRSLIALALGCLVNGQGQVFGIDPWDVSASISGFEEDKQNREWWRKVDHDVIYRKCLESCGRNGVLDFVSLIRAKSEQMALWLGASAPFIDILHIDGNHSEPHSVHDVTHYIPKVKPGGIICFDDTNWNCTKRAQQIIAESCEFLNFVESPGQQCAFYRKR